MGLCSNMEKVVEDNILNQRRYKESLRKHANGLNNSQHKSKPALSGKTCSGLMNHKTRSKSKELEATAFTGNPETCYFCAVGMAHERHMTYGAYDDLVNGPRD